MPARPESRQVAVAHELIAGCRSCGSASLELVLDLGTTPLADRILTPESAREPEPVCPLTVAVCRDCSLMQIRETVAPEILFGSDYPLITPERWMKDFEVAGFKPEVMPGILKGNAVRLLGLDKAAA